VILFHGTDEGWAAQIVNEGFTRRGMGSRVVLVLTDSLAVARYYAAVAGYYNHGAAKMARGVVLAADVKEDDLQPDLRAYEILNKERLQRGENPVTPPTHWKRSLKEIGAVVHMGEIPAESVRLVEYVRPAKRTRIADPRPLVRSLAL